MDVRVCGRSLSIKTKSNPGYGNVTLVWTVDWNRVDTFVKNYMPSSDLLYVNIIWDNDGGFFLIPQEVQQATWQRDKTLLKERALYHRWIELWDSL